MVFSSRAALATISGICVAAASTITASSPSTLQHVFSQPHQTSPPEWTRLSWDGLHINGPPHGKLDRYLTLSTLDKAELDASTATLHFEQPVTRTWEDVALHCGTLAGIEGCRQVDTQDFGQRLDIPSRQTTECQAVVSTLDGRALFDPLIAGCEPLAALWNQLEKGSASVDVEEILTTLNAHLKVHYSPTASRTGVYERDFWLAHLLRQRGAWPLSNARWKETTTERDNAFESEPEDDWRGGQQPNRVTSLMTDPYLPRTEKPLRNDDLNGVDVTYARWNLGVSIQLPPLPSNLSGAATEKRQSTLEPVHSPVSGQVVYVSTYRRYNAPESGLNDERSWVISVRDHWGFVWHLLGISPYRQHVYVGQHIEAGYVVGHVSLRPFVNKEPRDREAPVDPPEKPPGGDGNARYPYWARELRIGVARPSRSWQTWPGPYDDRNGTEGSWTWYNPLNLLSAGDSAADSFQQSPPPMNPVPYVFFARPSPYPPSPPTIFESAPVSIVPDRGGGNEGDDQGAAELSGNVEIIAGFTTYAAGPVKTDTAAAASLFPVSVYKLEWALLPWTRGKGARLGNATTVCAGREMHESDWRIAFEHSKVQQRSEGGEGWDSATTEAGEGTIWKYMVPAFTTGRWAWTRTKYASQFDWKSRSNLFYPLTRTLISSSSSSSVSARARGVGQLPTYGSWNTRLDSPPGSGRRPDDGGRGDGEDFVIAVRATDAWGGVTCARTTKRIRIRN